MNRYLLFMGEAYYPSGGWCDYAGTYPTVEAAQQRVAGGIYTYHNGTVQLPSWAHIVDGETLQPVAAYSDYPEPGWSDDPGFVEEQVTQYVFEKNG